MVILLLIHVLAAITAVGANLTYAIWFRAAGTDQDRLVFVIRTVRAIDSRLANPAYIVLLITGVLMVLSGAYSFTTGWILAAIGLYIAVAVIGIAAFGPAIRRQLVEAERDVTSSAYQAAARRSTTLGLITTALVLLIVVLMVTKPF
ncbi:MAG TPA: DUF2269 family protein [Candidatus Limnocylindria bacterium]|nr:DUF2269 family protein [Candidatus Limnocylindria bacterium]